MSVSPSLQSPPRAGSVKGQPQATSAPHPQTTPTTATAAAPAPAKVNLLGDIGDDPFGELNIISN